MKKRKSQMLKYIINIIFLIVGILSISSTSWAKINHILPSGFQLGFDIPRPLYYMWKEKTGIQYELHTNLDFNSVLLEGEYGWGTVTRKNPPSKPNAIAANIGQYFRIGFSYNFINNSVGHNAAFLGLRYSKAYFRDEIYGGLEQEDFKFWQATTDMVHIDQNDNLAAHWFEIVAGVRVKVWKWIYIGCTARYKFAKKISVLISQNPFDIIGWGLNQEDVFGLNYYISFRIPLQADILKQSLIKKGKKG